jgi:hypothetical protein
VLKKFAKSNTKRLIIWLRAIRFIFIEKTEKPDVIKAKDLQTYRGKMLS